MSEISAELEEAIIQALAHESRRTMLKIISSSEKGASYTELMVELGISTGKLNYHLKTLEGVVEKNKEQKYVLTPLGRRVMSLLSAVTENIDPKYENYVKTARLAQRSTLHPLAKSFIYIGIVWGALILAVWGYLAYIAITEGAPIIVYILLPALFILGSAMLGWLIYALKTAPEIIKRFERRLLGSR
jgi:predicted transcriptional regulator